MEPGQGAVVAPAGEVAVHGGPGRVASGQVAPRAAGPPHIQDGVHDLAQRVHRRPPPPAGNPYGQEGLDQPPPRIGQVTGIAAGRARSLGTRGPHLVLDRHTSGSWGPRPDNQRTDTHPARGAYHPAAPAARIIKHSLSSRSLLRGCASPLASGPRPPPLPPSLAPPSIVARTSLLSPGGAAPFGSLMG